MEVKKSKKAGFLIRFLGFILVASIFFTSQVVLAAGSSTIDETFNVKEHLTTDGQKDSKFVPKKEASLGENDEGPLAEGELQRGETNIGIFLVEVIDLLVKIIGSVALVVFILGALLTIASEGKEDRLEKGKTAMLYALVGLIIALFSFIIIAFVQSIFF